MSAVAPPPVPAGARAWVAGARPRTLPAAVVPVAVGTGVAWAEGGGSWWRALLALVVSLALQVGVNYANDYSDGVRGTDDVRVGPLRLVASGAKPAAAVKRAAYLSFAVAAAAGIVLAAVASWWLVLVGAAAVLAAWGYTGGPRPYGYAGLGEAFVFTFFGLVATAGTAFVQTERLTSLALVAGVPMGLLACALLVVNNLRDIPGDRTSGKHTLAVRLGDHRTRAMYAYVVAAGVLTSAWVAVAADRLWPLLGVLGLAVAAPPVLAVRRGAAGRDLIPVLGATAKVHLVTGALLTLGLVLSR